MKRTLSALAGIGLLMVSQAVLSSEEENYQQRCQQQAVEDGVDESGLAEYMSDCIRYYQDSEPLPLDESAVAEEESGQVSAVQE